VRISLMLLALFVAFATVPHAHATSVWTINGASCVPGDPAIQSNRYLITGGTVKHQPNAIGLITLYCPITFPDLISSTCHEALFVTYADSDGIGTVANVTAQLIQLDHSTGALTNLGSPLNSNSFGPTTGTEMSTRIDACLSGFNQYYVRVDINRSKTSQSATFFGLPFMGV
jgi:hypothetical protein